MVRAALGWDEVEKIGRAVELAAGGNGHRRIAAAGPRPLQVLVCLPPAKHRLAKATNVLVAPRGRVQNARATLNLGPGTANPGLQLRKAAAARLPEADYRRIVQEVEDLSVFTLDLGGHVVTMNDAAWEATGYSPEEAAGASYRAFFRPTAMAAGRLEQLLRTTLADRRCVDEGWQSRKDGSMYFVKSIWSRIDSANGAVLGFSVIARDLTDSMLIAESVRAEHAILQAIIVGRPLNQVFTMVARAAQRLIMARGALVLVRDERSKVLNVRAATGRHSPFRIGGVVPAAAIQRFSRAATIQFLPKTELERIARRNGYDKPLVNALTVPIGAGEGNQGVLLLLEPGLSPLEAAEGALGVFASHVRVALKHARHRRDLERWAMREERERIALDLHDGLVESVVALRMEAEAVARSCDTGSPAEKTAGVMISHIDSLYEDLQLIVNGLYGADRSTMAAPHRQ